MQYQVPVCGARGGLLLRFAIAVLALSVAVAMNSGAARAQANTPGKTIRIVVGFGAGATDIVARGCEFYTWPPRYSERFSRSVLPS